MFSFDDLGGMGIVIAIPGLLTFIGYIMACVDIPKTAREKGNTIPNGAGLLCFLFGLPYMLALGSLPDLKARNAGNTPNTDIIKTNTSTSVSEKTDIWVCPSCGVSNPNTVRRCKLCGIQGRQ